MLAKGKHTHTRTHKNQLGLTLRGPQADGQDRPIGLMKHAPAESGGQKAPLRALEDAATRAPALQGQQLLIEAFSSLQIYCAEKFALGCGREVRFCNVAQDGTYVPL